jgi:hypothetical protein
MGQNIVAGMNGNFSEIDTPTIFEAQRLGGDGE